MTNYLVLTALGIVQGLTEFLPVSSSGHLVLLEQSSYFKEQLSIIGKEGFLFLNVALHLATLMAVIIYLRKDIAEIISGIVSGIRSRDLNNDGARAGLYIIIASVPAGLIGVIFHDFFKDIFTSASSACIMLIINGVILLSTKFIPQKNRKLEETGIIRSILIGFFQAFAILPGISRSGMTISGGMAAGLEPVASARFSFLMAVPVIAGAGLVEGLDAAGSAFPAELLIPLAVSMLATLAVALLSLKLLFAVVRSIRLYLFGLYTLLLGAAGLIVIHIMR